LKQFGKYFLIGLTIIGGCDDEPANKIDDSAFFPLQTDQYQIYTVEQNIYSEINPDESLVYELKMEVVDSFQNLGGDYSFVIHRSTRPTANDLWQFLDTWSAQVSVSQAIRSEGNISYVALAFPLFSDKEWNGNAFNTLEEDVYRIQSKGGLYQLDTGLEFEDVLVVNQEDKVDELLRDQREEVYAPNVGLIYKKSIVINYCDESPCFGQQIIKDGVEYWQTLKEYGQN
jgi:hypothetical protein